MIEELKQLPFTERLQLAEDLWDSIADDPLNNITLSTEQIRELDYRLNLLEAEPKSGTLWSSVRDSLK